MSGYTQQSLALADISSRLSRPWGHNALIALQFGTNNQNPSIYNVQ